jgi:hypothetical protein
MQEEDPKQLIKRVLNATEKLLSERFGVLTPEQMTHLQTVKRSAEQFELLVTYADDTASANARKFLAYETRETLVTVLGYTEMMGEGMFGTMNTDQLQQVFAIRAQGKMLLVWLDDLLTTV